MATDHGEPQGERRADHSGFLYPAGHLRANHLAAGPTYLFFRCPAATINHSLVWHNKLWGGRFRPDSGRSAFLGFYGSGYWPGNHDHFGHNRPDFWLLSRMGGRDSLAADQCIPGIANVASSDPASGFLA